MCIFNTKQFDRKLLFIHNNLNKMPNNFLVLYYELLLSLEPNFYKLF